MLDIFSNNIFSTTTLTDAINKIPFMPGRLGQLIDWNEGGVPTLTIVIEEVNGVLRMVTPVPRGGPGQSIGKDRRMARHLGIPHYQRDDGVYADEVQGIRPFGQETGLMQVQALIDGRMAQHTADFDVSLEYQRLGAVKGIILNADGSTLYNLYDEFDVDQAAEIDFDLDNASPASGALRAKCADVVRDIMNSMGGTPVSSIHAVVGDTFFDQLIAHPEVVKSYLNTPMATILRDGYILPSGDKIYGVFEFGGIVWENYRGAVVFPGDTDPTAFVAATKAFIFPLAPQIFKTTFGPADYMETVNTMGKPRYAKQFPWPDDKGVHLQMQMNALSYCTRPNALRQGRNT